jgi:hypothetical protein
MMDLNQIKTFQTSGPCFPDENYMIPAADRNSEILPLISDKKYFVIHAPRHSGKTTFLNSLTDIINSEGHYFALLCPLSFPVETFNFTTASEAILQSLIEGMHTSEVPSVRILADTVPRFSQETQSFAISNAIQKICCSLEKELVIFFDDADSIPSSFALPFLNQIEVGFKNRQNSGVNAFPRSIALAGLHQLKNYQFESTIDSNLTVHASPFNIGKLPLTLPNFSIEQIRILYRQHTDASGQIFEENAIQQVWHLTSGQPWLVNVLASDIIKLQLDNNYSIPINVNHVNLAANNLFMDNGVHLSSLTERLEEPRVRKVMDFAMSPSGAKPDKVLIPDINYCIDLGLLKSGNSNGISDCVPANKIFNEMIVRTTSSISMPNQDNIPGKMWYDQTELDISSALKSFQKFWIMKEEIFSDNIREDEYTESIIIKFTYASATRLITQKQKDRKRQFIINNIQTLFGESFCILVLCTYLQKTFPEVSEPITREFSDDNKSANIYVNYNGILYPIRAILKGTETTEKGIRQLSSHIDKCNNSKGWLVEFAMKRDKPLKRKRSFKTYTIGKRTVFVLNC